MIPADRCLRSPGGNGAKSAQAWAARPLSDLQRKNLRSVTSAAPCDGDPADDHPHLTAGSWRLGELADGFLVTQLLYAAAELRLADVLAAGPADGPAVARAVGAHPDTVTRILRGLCAAKVFAETDSSRFSLGPLGEYLRDGVPGSQRGPILARGAIYYAAAGGLLDAARTGENAFEQAYGESFFAHLQRVAALRQAFEAP
ncbi:hypothetical protein OHA21_16415 [Actinoplanes sp. NBC_00393]|uniref:methyltransferase family protein n=1 Tax=Actinoplanes sp. NBC_00393 TaxID=2975953 RepID=UPI002E20BBE8